MQFRVGSENMCFVHVSYVPVLGVVGEQKTKPTQHSVQVLRSLGLNPQLICCRCEEPLQESVRSKLAGFCQVKKEAVLTLHNVSNIWHVPLIMEQQAAHRQAGPRLAAAAPHGTPCDLLPSAPPCPLELQVLAQLGLQCPARVELSLFQEIAWKWDNVTEVVTIAMVGKYTELSDAYLSVIKAGRRC